MCGVLATTLHPSGISHLSMMSCQQPYSAVDRSGNCGCLPNWSGKSARRKVIAQFLWCNGESFQEALHLSPSSEFGQFTLAFFDTLWCELALKNGEGRDTRRGPERKAAPREVRSAALEWGTAHACGTSFDRERQLSGSARPHRTALEARYPCLCEILQR